MLARFNLVQPVRDMWWTLWHLDRFFFECLGFTLSVSLHQGCFIAFIYKLLFPEGQVGDAWKPLKTNAVSENSITAA
jgi:hypothetical protein